ncbi:MAG: GspH/FimT family pseudopilin [Gammaproteobacteria bacterium]|nr:GspH/FimT family pseudopilin [Gammaproteobacteria bacterium]
MKPPIDQHAGYTIVEIMIAIAILAILTALAMPSLQQFMARNELVGTSNALITGINLARTEAVTRSTAVAICPSTDGATCSGGDWESGFLVFVDDNNNSSFNGGEELIRAESGYTNPAITIDGTGGLNNGFTFSADGIRSAVVGAGTIDLNHNVATNGIQIIVNNTGQISRIEI